MPTIEPLVVSPDGIELLRETEVGEIRVLLAVLDRDHDVSRLDVSMYEPAAVRGVERGSKLVEQVDCAVGIERPLLDQDLAQVGPGDEVHHKEQHSVLLAGIVDSDDVRMVQRRGDPHLPLEPLAEPLILGQPGRQHLQRVNPVQRDVRGAVHEPHAATPDELVDPVATDDRAASELIASYRHSCILLGSTPPEV